MTTTEGIEVNFNDPAVRDAFDLAVRTLYVAGTSLDTVAAREAGRAFDELFRRIGGDRDTLFGLVSAAAVSGPANWPRKIVADA